MKKIYCLLGLLLTMAAFVSAEDLYKVTVTSESDAAALRAAEVEPVLRLTGGYLVLTDSHTASELENSGLTMEFLASNIEAGQIAVDNRFDKANTAKYQVIYEDGGLRLFRVDKAAKALSIDGAPLIPIDNHNLAIEYSAPVVFNKDLLWGDFSYDSLIAAVSQDTVDAYLHRLQAFNGRVTGTDSNYAARDWIYDRFASYGLDSVVLDSFTGIQLGDGSVPAYNVVAYKTGTRYPGRQVVVGGHFDAVPGSPGADDNGTGTVGTLEFARVLKDFDTDMTFIFIAFDSEESGLIGSRHYADAAAARGDTIVYMLNMDMIGALNNDNLASLHQGPNDEPYAQLWGRLADSLVGITGVITGPSGGSDHYYFAQNGYDVTFVQEYNFSTVYHQPRDSTTYINFDYFTRMVKASLATAYAVNTAPKPITITSILDVGDGQSLEINWIPGDPAQIDHYWLHYTTVPATQPDSIQVPVDSSTYVVEGLTEGQEYSFHIIAVDIDGRSSVAFNLAYGTPYSIPVMPTGLTALPLKDAIKLGWAANNKELDLDHYVLFRDGGMLPDLIHDTVFTDDDPSLDTTIHEYFVAAVDKDGNLSDTAGAPRASMRAATLQAGRILALNRSASNSQAMVNEVVTGEFMREALTGLNYDYFSDTSSSNPNRANLISMVDYGLVVIGAESGRSQDDIGNEPIFGGILEDITYYLSIGGKVIIFGRWGDIALEPRVDTVYFSPGTSQFDYYDYFGIAFRILPLSYLNTSTSVLESDFIGAHSQMTGYPDLDWDESATIDHTGGSYNAITGIPCPSLPFLIGSGNEVLYTYHSSSDSILTEGKTIGWRHLGADDEYVFFEIPLSFMQRPQAVAALQQAVSDLGIISDVNDNPTAGLPAAFSLAQNYPNPFNPNTRINFYNPSSKPAAVILEIFNILGQRTRLLIDGPVPPGPNEVEWDGTDDAGSRVATGIYFYRLKTDKGNLTRKMVLLK